MKRSFKMIVMMLALTFGALIFNGASSQAAVSITNVKQTKASSNYVELQWDAVIYGDSVYITVYTMVHPPAVSQVTVTLTPPMRHCII